jgi:hypothetical protein
MKITYKINPILKAQEFIDILERSTLAQRRPVDDLACVDGMLKNADIIIVAIHDGLSAPKATEYYPKIGFTQHPSAWVIESTKVIE